MAENAKPMPFIYLDGHVQDKNSKFVVNTQAVEALKQLSGPVVVIAIAGLYRTGKSFVMNQLADSQGGFDLGYSVQPKTQGLWIWIVDSKKIRHKFSLPQDCSVVLLDTEGLGSYTKTETYDAKIFALAILLSSYLIYNSMGTIDDNAVDTISLLVEVTKQIQASSMNTSHNAYDLVHFFPKFMWLVRDFSLELVQDGKAVTPQQYLENALAPLPGKGDDIDTKNRTRECIRKFFPDRTCFTLKRPVVDEELLHELDKLNPKQLRPEYLEGAKKLCEYIYAHATPKTMYNCAVSGAAFAQLAQGYVDALNSGGVPVIQSTWEQVVQVQCQNAVSVAISSYKSTMNKCLQGDTYLDDTEFTDAHQEAQKKARTEFKNIAVGNDTERYLDELNKEIHIAYQTYMADNSKKGKTFCEDLLSKLLDEITTKVNNKSITDFDELSRLWQGLLTVYDTKAKGSTKHSVFHRLTSNIWLSWTRTITQTQIQTVETKLEAQIDALYQKHAKDYATLQELYKSVDSERQKQEEYTKSLRNENKDLKFEVGGLQKSTKEKQSEIDELVKEVENLKEFVKELEGKNMGLQENVKSTTETLTKVQEEAKDLQTRYNQETQKAETEIAQLKATNTELTTIKASLELEVEKNQPGYEEQCVQLFEKEFEEMKNKKYDDFSGLIADMKQHVERYETSVQGWKKYAVLYDRLPQLLSLLNDTHVCIIDGITLSHQSILAIETQRKESIIKENEALHRTIQDVLKEKTEMCDVVLTVEKSLAEKVEEVRKLNNLLIEKDGELNQLNNLLTEKDGEEKNLNNSLVEKEEELKHLNKLLAEKENQLQKLSSQHDEATTKLNTISTRVTELETSHNDKTQELQQLNQKLLDQEATLTEKTATIERLRKRLKDQEQVYDSAMSTLNLNLNSLTDANERISKLEDEMKQMEETQRQMKIENEELKARITEKEQSMERLKTEVKETEEKEKLVNENEQLKQKLLEQDQSMEKLMAEMKEKSEKDRLDDGKMVELQKKLDDAENELKSAKETLDALTKAKEKLERRHLEMVEKVKCQCLVQ